MGRACLPFAASRRDARTTHKPEGWTPVEPDWSVLLKDGEGASPTAPAGLAWDAGSLAAAASAEWRRVVPLMRQNHLMSHLDDVAIADYCVCWARLQWAERTLTRTGPFMRGERGIQRNPVSPLIREYRKQVRSYQVVLYLTPASRASLLRAQPADQDDLTRFLTS